MIESMAAALLVAVSMLYLAWWRTQRYLNLSLYFDFKNITFNNEKFAKRNNIISIDKIDSIKKNIIQAYKINVALIEALYTKITVSIPAIYLLNQNRPKIVASKKGNSYLPEL